MGKSLKMTTRSLIFSLVSVLIGATTSFAAMPAAPTLYSPTSGSNVGGNQITFKWILDPNAAYYFLYIAKDQNFSQMIVNTGAFASSTGTYDLATQDIGQVYYWKMAAMNVYGYSPFSATWSVINGPSTAPPSTPTLWYPGNGVDINDTELTLMWYADRAADYYLQVATTPQFTDSTIVFGKWIGNNDTYLIGGLLNYGETYYWRVKAKNSYGESSYSSYQWFRYYDSLTCTSTYGSGIGVTGNTQSHIDTCNANGGYYLYDISRRTGQQAGHDHAGAMNSAAAIKTKHFFGLIYDADNYWANNPSYELRPLVDGHVYAAKVYDYLYNDTKGWSLNSYDGLGSSMVSMAEKPCYDTDITNAKWDGAKVIYYASCDGAAKSYAGALDLIADAWGDAVTAKTSGLYLQYESGALRIAFSDWLAASVENHYDPGNWNWTIGEDVLNIQRDLSNPKSFSHPDTYKGLYYYDTTYCTPTISNDYCYVHTNSGVPNKMFYLLSQGGTLNGVTVQGIGITKAMAIAYRANINKYWPANATFRNALTGMIRAANDLYSTDPNISAQVKSAWAAVGAGLPVISTSASPADGGITTGDGDYEWGQSVIVTATANTGYTFDRWTENGSTVSSDPSGSYTFTVDGSRSLVANFVTSIPSASVSPSNFDYDQSCPGKSQTASFTVKNIGGGQLEIYQASLTDGSPDYSISSDGCLNASLSAGASCNVDVIFSPSPTAASSLTIQGHLRISFKTSSVPYLIIPLSGINRNLSTYKIIATAGDGGSITPSGDVIVCGGDSQFFNTKPNDNTYITSDIKVDGVSNSGNSYIFTNISADHTIAASFRKLYDIEITTLPGANGGTVTPTSSTSTTQTFTIAPASGYKTVNVVIDNVSQGAITSYTFTDIAVAHSIKASFTTSSTPTYTISATAGTGGSMTPSGTVTVAQGGSQAFTLTPTNGYHIASVTGCNGSLNGNTYTIGAINANCTVTADFSNTYTITATANSGGSIYPYGTVSVAAGGSQIYTMTPNTGFRIVDVKVDGVSVGALSSYTFPNITTNHTIDVSYDIRYTYIFPRVSGRGTISWLGGSCTRRDRRCDILVPYGSSQALTITPDAGSYIGAISGCGGTLSGNTYTIASMTETCVMTASFARYTYLLTVTKTGSGTGTVTSTPSGISCGSTCSGTFSSVTLTPVPDSNSIFSGWSGGWCSGTGNCVTVLNSDAAVTATFNIKSPVANFTAAPTSGYTPSFTVNFTDTSTNSPTSWSWSFGDGGTSTLRNPSHTYTSTGTYTVTLTATNASGSNTVTKSNIITVQTCPNQPVRIVRGGIPVYFSTINSAYSSAVDGETIQAQAVTFMEGINSYKTITLDGGYDCTYSSKGGYTTLKGSQVNISGGTATIKDVVIDK